MNHEPERKESFVEALFTGVVMGLLAIAILALLIVSIP